MTHEYEKNLRKGEEYQDFVTRTLYHLGVPLVQHTSKKYQTQYGENMIGWEIKFVDTMRQFNALYIEYAEKADARNSEYVPSGILRKDNTIFMVMGDYNTFYVIEKARLRNCYLRKLYLNKQVGGWDIPPTPTSKAFALPLTTAEKIKVFKVEIEDGIPRIETN